MELCIQLATIMIGNQAINSILEITVPFLQKLYNSFKIKTGLEKEVKDDLICCNQWTEDYKLLGWDNKSLYFEYLEMGKSFYYFFSMLVINMPC